VNEDFSPLKRTDSMDSVQSRRGRSRSRQRLDQLANAGKERLQGVMDNVAGHLGYTRMPSSREEKDSAKDSDSN
jgi:hypothetical protein